MTEEQERRQAALSAATRALREARSWFLLEEDSHGRVASARFLMFSVSAEERIGRFLAPYREFKRLTGIEEE